MLQELHALYRAIWDEREDEEGYCYCFESGEPMHGLKYRNNSCCYHHVLSKSKYPNLVYDRSNIVIIHPDVHTRVERDIDSCPKIKNLKDKLKRELDDRGYKEGLLE